MNAIEHAVALPPDEVVVHRATRRKILRNIAPLTTGAQDVHQAVHHRTHVGAALAAARPRRRNERRDNRPLLVREVARVPQMITIVSRSVFLRPHRQPHESDCLLSITNDPVTPEVSRRTLNPKLYRTSELSLHTATSSSICCALRTLDGGKNPREHVTIVPARTVAQSLDIGAEHAVPIYEKLHDALCRAIPVACEGLKLGQKTIRVPPEPKRNYRHTSGECEAHLLVGPIAVVESLRHHGNERIHAVERVLDLVLPSPRRMDILVGHEARDAKEL